MRILVLNPAYGTDFCRSARWAAKSRGRVQRHPDGMLIAVAVLERAGHELLFLDAAALNLDRQSVRAGIERFRPEMAVMHTTTPSIYNDLEYAALARECGAARTVLIGPHVSALARETLALPGADGNIIAHGEYDFTLRDIASGASLENIAGISFMRGAEYVRTGERRPLDVNELPFPAWHHIKPEWYRDAGKRFPFLTLISGRGCHGSCIFCRDTPILGGHALRMRSPALVVDEMESDMRLFPQLREIMFETDSFTASPAHVRGVCEEILRRGLKITWSCNTRVDLDLELLPLMRKAGCRMLMVGFEFGTQEALDAVRKGITLAQSRTFAARAAKLGFTLHGCFMVGAPGETRESARKTIEFAKSLPLDTVQFSGICVYPGTMLYDWAKREGFLVPHDWREWVSPELEQITLLSYPQLSKAEIDALIDRGLREFYFRPSQILRMIFNLESAGDLLRKIYGLKSFVSYLSGRGRKHG
ncbi:MAG: radical SAM protein [Elusimicrobia bacterium]|nr:radical SAM protein [Elusimicrobiota bacterium]